MFESIGAFFNDLLCAISGIYPESRAFRETLLMILEIFTIHENIYWLIGLFFTRKFKPAKNYHKYAILIPARNEEAVIGNLLDSIDKQDYPKELITVFVVADNCTDGTAAVVRQKGVVCYERFNDNERTKGFALKFLFESIKRDYGIEAFEGYFVFDSDNLLKSDYISRMNDSFDAGEKIITSYRNTKNFDENWVASTYALHWLRSIRKNHRTRSFLRVATNIQGTGFLFANELVKDGWKYTSLTEDRAFTADAVAHGYQISYNDDAIFYDEQPTSLKIALRQRLRWSKGHLMAFVQSGGMLARNVFLGNWFRKKRKRSKITIKSVLRDIWDDLRYRWASFDIFSQMLPKPVIKLVLWLAVRVFIKACRSYEYGESDLIFDPDGDFVHRALHFIFGDVYVDEGPGMRAFIYSICIVVLWNILSKLYWHIRAMTDAIYLFIVENRRIKKINIFKKILYCITWPTFDIIGKWTMYIAVFKKVTWKPIPHNSKVTISDLEKGK